MSARIYDSDGTPMRRTPDGELVPDVDKAPRPSPLIPATCPGCGLRRGLHTADCAIGGDNPSPAVCRTCHATIAGCVQRHINSGRPCCTTCTHNDGAAIA